MLETGLVSKDQVAALEDKELQSIVKHQPISVLADVESMVHEAAKRNMVVQVNTIHTIHTIRHYTHYIHYTHCTHYIHYTLYTLYDTIHTSPTIYTIAYLPNPYKRHSERRTDQR